jgi:hypothetical protein
VVCAGAFVVVCAGAFVVVCAGAFVVVLAVWGADVAGAFMVGPPNPFRLDEAPSKPRSAPAMPCRTRHA